jgi:UDP-N-acetylmuramoylalanine--D-glutamate ligase
MAMVREKPDPFQAASSALNGRRAAVVGAGRSGRSAAAFLARAGAEVHLVDTRDQPPEAEALSVLPPTVTTAFGALGERALTDRDLVVVSPGLPLSEPAVAAARAAGAEVVGDVELFGRFANAPVVAVTGSNGKSTVTTLVGELFTGAGRTAPTGGNLGVPALELLRSPPPDAYILEVSSFQAEALTTFRPDVGVLINLSPDHLDRYASYADYVAAKLALFARMGPEQDLVANAADPEVVAALSEHPARLHWFGPEAPGERGAGLVAGPDGPWLAAGTPEGPAPVLALAEWPLVGEPNRDNALAAIAAATAAGLPPESLGPALRGFTGLAHRMEPVAQVAGVRYINDSKGTNVGAVAAALHGLPGDWVWIAGGVSKGADFAELVPVLREHCREAVLIGEAAAEIAQALRPHGIPVTEARDMPTAVGRAAQVARAGEAVVLSPACTSFDQYADYAQRGEDFRRQVGLLEATRG